MTTLQSNLLENHTPTGREEAWRFTPLKRLAGLHDGTATPVARKSLAAKGSLPAGVTFTFGEISAVTTTDDAIVNRVRAFTSEGATLSIAANTEVAEPIFLGRSTGALDTAEFSRVRITLGNHAVATVIVENTTDTVLAEDLEINLAPGSNLKFVTKDLLDIPLGRSTMRLALPICFFGIIILNLE